jgi:ferredoxin
MVELRLLEPEGLERLIQLLRERGYTVVGPVARDGVILYDEVRSSTDLPAGWGDEQDAGTYRLRRRDDGALFGYAAGPHSWKRFLHPASVRLWRAHRQERGFEVADGPEPVARLAFLGVRPCDLHAIAILDRVLLEGPYPDPVYRARRREVLLVAVQCGAPSRTCFCASMGTGPRAAAGFDLALTEVCEAGRHCFVVEAGSPAGAALLGEIPHRPATPEEAAAAAGVTERAARAQVRALETEGLPALLRRSYEHPAWHRVADRCLACGNCTMACPTCFCTTVEDVAELGGKGAERVRHWDSCFTQEFSYIHGGSVRRTVRARYRQWLTHKLGTWHDQFGSSGCVGCGRCITWCPASIDITEEARALRATPKKEAHRAIP